MGERVEGSVVRGRAHLYTVRCLLGRGGTAHTYEATTEDGVLVVLKELRLDVVSSWKAIELLEREARALARIEHPSVPRYIDSFALDESGAPVSDGGLDVAPLAFLLVQSKIDGASIAQCVAREGPLAPARVESILRKMCDVLTYLHGHSPPIVHRDITPRNLLVSENGSVHLVDFGAVQDRLRREASMVSTTAGTVGYAPMEQWMGMARPASDLYSLGMTLLYALTALDPSHLPFDERRERVDIDKAIPHAPPQLRRALLSMIESRIAKRAQGAKSVLAILDGRVRFSPIALATGIALGTLLVGAAALFFLQSDGPPPPRVAHAVAFSGSPEEAWFARVRPHCNSVEIDVTLRANPPLPSGEGAGYASACHALAGRIEAADAAIGGAPPSLRGRAVSTLFNVIHPVADQGDDRAAGPVMLLVLRYWPENYMAMYHAGMAQYGNGDRGGAEKHLTQFVGTYKVNDGFRQTAERVLGALHETTDRDCNTTLATDPEGRRVLRKCGLGRE